MKKQLRVIKKTILSNITRYLAYELKKSLPSKKNSST